MDMGILPLTSFLRFFLDFNESVWYTWYTNFLVATSVRHGIPKNDFGIPHLKNMRYTNGIPTLIGDIMSKQIKVSDEVHAKLVDARVGSESISGTIERLLRGNEASDMQEVVDMSDWVEGQAPKCCIDSIANDFKPGHICPDWVRIAYTDKNGLRRQAWFNNKTGEYEFSDRWKQIRADYRYE